MAVLAAQNQRWRHLMARGVHEFKRLLMLFVNLRVIFGLFVLNEDVILAKQNISYSAQGFALINAFVLTKVMLVAEDLKLGHRFKDRSLIYPVLYKACAFAALFILFHILGPVDGLHQDQSTSKSHKSCEAFGCLLAAQSNPLEPL